MAHIWFTELLRLSPVCTGVRPDLCCFLNTFHGQNKFVTDAITSVCLVKRDVTSLYITKFTFLNPKFHDRLQIRLRRPV